MTLARSMPDSPAEWGILLGALAVYLLGRWFFAWRQARAEGHRRPARAALHDAGDDDAPGQDPNPWGYKSWQEFLRFEAPQNREARTEGRSRT
ncbi:hypothetical protein [Streptomyces sp. NPDC016845]|uniref:hypothetical protein n=1 Tax=Streptomyces sp. NPDC016845 TaxID=3364972 RepID=UPI00379D18E7